MKKIEKGFCFNQIKIRYNAQLFYTVLSVNIWQKTLLYDKQQGTKHLKTKRKTTLERKQIEHNHDTKYNSVISQSKKRGRD